MTRPCRTDALMIAAVTIKATLSGDARGAQDASATLTPAALAEIAQVEAGIDRIEAQTLERLAAPPDSQVQQIELLGKLMLYDKDLSVNRNEACAFCHTPETGFTGPVSELNRTTGSYPGSVRTRFSDRKPQSHAYAPLAPVLHYNPGQGDLVGGNFWDMRATGRRLGGPGEDPLFTDFTASNIGTPANPLLPYYAEDRPDARGYVANPAGSSFVDGGVGRFLTQTHLLSQPSPVDARWLPLAPDNQGRFRVPTLRNVDKRPDPTFVKAYGHNGYFKSLKSIVHFYNTRDVLPR